MKVNSINIDDKSRDVLTAVAELEEPVRTGDIKQMTGISENKIVLYRLDKLEEADLVATSRVNKSEWDKQIARPTTASLTDAGERLLDSDDIRVEAGDDDLTMRERMLRVERELDAMRDTYTEVKRRIVEIEDELDAHDDDLDDVSEEIEGLKRFLNDRLD